MDNVPSFCSPVSSEENGAENGDSSSNEDGINDAFGDLAALPVEVGERRPTCLRCRHPELAAVCRDSRTLILYPGPKSQNLDELVQHQEVGTVTHNVIIIDGTWSQAKNMFLKNSLFHLPKQVQLNRTLSSQYVIRTQPSNICLSTLECAAVSLSILEQNDDIQEVLLRPLKALCSFQLQHGAQVHHSKEHLLKNGMYDKPMPKNKRKIKRMEKLVTDHNVCPR
ncbi:DTW domain containing protein 2 [Dissostichus eleginoides]|uniref:tRNA-uridine aminocarboxypropyltransferase n=1 Tax=Dissostichus eleginoides TaxID=100907 RepID=A0AAD9BHL1_DISEL|nr:DTW domain containing protein 2 [Dissostichus eleginoides]